MFIALNIRSLCTLCTFAGIVVFSAATASRNLFELTRIEPQKSTKNAKAKRLFFRINRGFLPVVSVSGDL